MRERNNRSRGTATEKVFKETLHAVQNRWPGLGVIDGPAQRSAVRHTVREPGNELLHLAGRAVHFFFHQHPEIRADHLVAISFGRLVVTAGIGMLSDLAENPRIRRRRAPDHYGIASGLPYHGD